MKTLIKVALMLIAMTAPALAANDIEIRGSIPESHRLIRVYGEMASQTESIWCATVTPVGVIGVKFQKVQGHIEYTDEVHRTFSAVIPGSKLSELRSSFCRYEAPAVIAVLENENGEEKEFYLSEQNGEWTFSRR